MEFLPRCLIFGAVWGRCEIFFYCPFAIGGSAHFTKSSISQTIMEPPSKKMRKLLEHDSDSDSGDESGGVLLGKQSPDAGFKINEEFARRFEHNKKREEVARCMCWKLSFGSMRC